MTKEELKALGLTDEQADKVVKDYQDNYVAKTEYDTQATALKQAQDEQKKAAKALDDLKKSHEKDGDLAAQIEQMKTDVAERQKQYDATIHQINITRTSRYHLVYGMFEYMGDSVVIILDFHLVTRYNDTTDKSLKHIERIFVVFVFLDEQP